MGKSLPRFDDTQTNTQANIGTGKTDESFQKQFSFMPGWQTKMYTARRWFVDIFINDKKYMSTLLINSSNP